MLTTVHSPTQKVIAVLIPKFLPILENTCKSSTQTVFDTAKGLGFRLPKKGMRRMAYKPGLSRTSPLVVCHADTVCKGGDGPHNFDVAGSKVTSIALDDRLGVASMFYAIKYKLPLADCAMLICDDEEIGRSTAQQFKLDISPDFLVELDRRGSDVVCYDYESTLLTSLLNHVGFSVGYGSFSDISYLGHYGVCGFNVGIGYHNEHSPKCHADLSVTVSQLSKLDKFLSTFNGVRLAWEDNYQAMLDNDRKRWAN